MSSSKTIFYQKYKKFLLLKGVSEKVSPYYQEHLKQWGRHLRRVKQDLNQTDEDLVQVDHWKILCAYFKRLGGNPHLEDWQIEQKADALRLAHAEMLEEAWAVSAPWKELVNEVIEAREPEIPEQFLEVNDVENAAREKGLSTAQAALVGSLVTKMRSRHYAYRTEQAYREWLERFLLWSMKYGTNAGTELESPTVEQARGFLEDLAVKQAVAKATQKQAVNALGYFFKQVLAVEDPDFSDFIPARASKRIPVVLGVDEVRELLLTRWTNRVH